MSIIAFSSLVNLKFWYFLLKIHNFWSVQYFTIQFGEKIWKKKSSTKPNKNCAEIPNGCHNIAVSLGGHFLAHPAYIHVYNLKHKYFALPSYNFLNITHAYSMYIYIYMCVSVCVYVCLRIGACSPKSLHAICEYTYVTLQLRLMYRYGVHCTILKWAKQTIF